LDLHIIKHSFLCKNEHARSRCVVASFAKTGYYSCSYSAPSVLWYCWLGLLTCKNRLPYNLYCVGGDMKQCSIQSVLGALHIKSLLQISSWNEKLQEHTGL